MTVNKVAEVSAQYLAELDAIVVPAGYKQTEVGVIPTDWQVVPLQSVCRAPITYGIVQCGPHVESGIPYIRVSDMNSSELDVSSMLRTSRAIAASFARSRVEEGDIVYALRGKLGEVKIVNADVAGANLTQGTARISPGNKVFSNYLYWILRSPDALKQAITEAKGSTFVEITLADLKRIELPVPSSFEEQTAIANALSDIDALISELEKLIAKKQAIKTATMQQLLTGRTRLPQFALREDGSKKGYKQSELGEIPEDWDVKTVYELADFQKSLFDDGDWVEAEHITDKGIRLIQTGNIGIGTFVEKDAKKYIFEASFDKLKCKQLSKGDLLICRLAEPAGRACILPDIGESKVITSVDVTIFRPTPEAANREFYNQYFSSIDWFKSVLEQVGGTTHKRISRGALGRISVLYPGLEEQTAIATILSDMDFEIQALQQRLAKTRQIKQGMMQELLTGKTRLINTAQGVA